MLVQYRAAGTYPVETEACNVMALCTKVVKLSTMFLPVMIFNRGRTVNVGDHGLHNYTRMDLLFLFVFLILYVAAIFNSQSRHIF